MAEKKPTVTEQHWDEVLSDNASLNHFSQCRDCFFRDRTAYTNTDGEKVECGWEKGFCEAFPYPEDKPAGVYNNSERCEYYERETPDTRK